MRMYCSTRALLHSWSDSLCLFRFSVSIPLYIGFIQYERILIISARDQVHGTFVSLTNSYFNWYTYKIRVQPTVRVHVRVRGLSVRVQYVYAPVLFVYVYVYAKAEAYTYTYTYKIEAYTYCTRTERGVHVHVRTGQFNCTRQHWSRSRSHAN